ncbi:MAG: HD domain-containing protein, partial [Deltaproteobacteria bacterium]|nr:HD domain-containing protein [Deltaproteobacteria bacterium]
MSGKQLIADIKEKDQVRSKFMVTKKDSSVSKAGKAYLSLRLADVSGELEARVWDNAVELGALFEKGDVVEVIGFGNSYMGKVQLNINSIKKISLEGFDPTEFLPSSKFPLEGMMSELESIIDEMKNKHLKELLNTIFADKKTRLSFMRSPAAKVMHHPYIGGLLEHVLSLAKLSRLVCSHYDEVEEDLVLTGLILHDIGKI